MPVSTGSGPGASPRRAPPRLTAHLDLQLRDALPHLGHRRHAVRLPQAHGHHLLLALGAGVGEKGSRGAAGLRGWGEWGCGHLALGLRLLAAALAELRLQPLVLRRQVLQLLLQRRALSLHTVQQVAVDVVLRADARGSRTCRGPDPGRRVPSPGRPRPTCVSSSTTRCRSSRPSASAWASRSRTLISSSCSSPRTSFRGDSFQRPPRDRWACGERSAVGLRWGPRGRFDRLERGPPSPARCPRAPAAAASAPAPRPRPHPPEP